MLCRAGRSLVAKTSSSLGSEAASGNRPRLLRSRNIVSAIPTCLRFDLHFVRRAASLTACTAIAVEAWEDGAGDRWHSGVTKTDRRARVVHATECHRENS